MAHVVQAGHIAFESDSCAALQHRREYTVVYTAPGGQAGREGRNNMAWGYGGGASAASSELQSATRSSSASTAPPPAPPSRALGRSTAQLQPAPTCAPAPSAEGTGLVSAARVPGLRRLEASETSVPACQAGGSRALPTVPM